MNECRRRTKEYVEVTRNEQHFVRVRGETEVKVGLIRTLVDRAYKINNTWLGLHEDITKIMDILKRIFSLLI